MYPKIVQEPQYDFSDVLIQPQRSRIVSRSHVMLEIHTDLKMVLHGLAFLLLQQIWIRQGHLMLIKY